MEQVTVRCTYCGELFTSRPVVESGKKYCTSVCASWDNPKEKDHVEIGEETQLELPLNCPPRAWDAY